MSSSGSRSLDSVSRYGSFYCTPCGKKDRQADAAQFCKQCKKHFCFACLRQHNDVIDDHTLISRKDLGSLQQDQRPHTDMNGCSKHNGDAIGMWCENHEEPMCSACAIVDHRDCKNILHILSDVKINGEDLKETQDDLNKTRNGLLRLRTEKQNDLKKSDTEKRRALDIIEAFEDKLEKLKRELGKKARAQVDVKYKDVQVAAYNDVEAIHDAINKLEKRSKNIQQNAGDNASRFINMKKGKQEIVAARAVSIETCRAPSNQGIIYLIDPELDDTISTLKTFGKVYQHLFSVKGKKEVKVMMSGEGKCNINDSCLLHDGSILLLDCGNNKLKKLTGDQITDSCTFPAGVIAVCKTGQQEVAVSLADNSIQLVTMAPRLTPTRLLKMGHPCWGLAYSHEELFISDNAEHVYVYKTNGTYLRTIGKGGEGNSMFKKATHLAVHTQRDEIFVSDFELGIVCMDRRGKHLYSFRNEKLKGVRGICSDNGEGLFVSGIQSNNIFQLGRGGQLIGIVADEGKGVKSPRSLLYNTQINQLVVTRDCQESILELDLA